MNPHPRSSGLIIACGALAREVAAVLRANRLTGLAVRCLPVELHNLPERIAGEVRRRLEAYRSDYARVFVAYADCGTGGRLDAVLDEFGTERLPGAHCYECYAGHAAFTALAAAEPGTFYLTDFLARHFGRLVWRGLGMDRSPELSGAYFRNYRRVVYLSQSGDPRLVERARTAAARLGLAFEHRHTGYGDLGSRLARFGAGG